MRRIIYIGAMMFTMLIDGCDIWGIDQFARECTGQIEDTINFSINATVYYHTKHKWPDDTNELEAFCADSNQPCTKVNWHAFADANFQTLPDGNLMVEIKQRTTSEQGPGTGVITLTVPVLAFSDEPNQDVNDFRNAIVIPRDVLADGNDRGPHR
jgi:hypothetical protein